MAGWIDNRVKGTTRVKIEFTDGFVMTLELEGNPHRDLAGCCLEFTNREPDREEKHCGSLQSEMIGTVGDITAARKVRVPLIPVREFLAACKRGETPPEEWRNSLYLEWYTENRGRLVLEATTFAMTLSEPSWEATERDQAATEQSTSLMLEDFLRKLDGGAPSVDLSKKEELDEFDWEKMFKESDRRTDRFLELREKYGDDEEKIFEAMGWDWGKLNRTKGNFHLEGDEAEPDESWLEEEEHPLMAEAAAIMEGLQPDKADTGRGSDLEFFVLIGTVQAKLAGALSNYEGHGIFGDKGFTIAALKRVLVKIDEAVAKTTVSHPSLSQKLLKLRSSVIDLQQDLRRD